MKDNQFSFSHTSYNIINEKNKKSPTEFDVDQRKQFLKGAEIAYETIITSFSKTTQPLSIILRI